MHSILLGTREGRDLNKIQGRTTNEDEISNKDDNFEYNSDPDYDTIDFSNWNMTKDVKKLTRRRNDKDGNSYKDNNNDNDNEYSDSDSIGYSRNAIQEDMEREAISAGMRSSRKRSRDNYEENGALTDNQQEEQ
jgi:hypothetical protein